MVRKKRYRFNKSSIKEGIRLSQRDSMTNRIKDDIKKKMDDIIKHSKQNQNVIQKTDETQGQKEVEVATGLVQMIPEVEPESENHKRFLAQLGYGAGTAVTVDRTSNEFTERKIHEAGVYTQPQNFVTKKSYTVEQIKKIFGEDEWKTISDDFENVYDESALLRFHDTLRVDGDVNKALLKANKFIIGPDYPQLMLDCNRSYPSPEAQSYELKKINNNFVYWSILNELKRIDQNVDTYNAMHTQLYQARGYQRGVLLVERDTATGIPIAIKPLSALRCGRVFAKTDTWRLYGIEYFDFKYPNNIILAEDLIYMTNRDYAQSIASMLYGYSDIEFVSHIVELNLIINSIVLKEINRTHWAPYVFIQLLETEDEAQATDFMAKAKRGLSMVSLLPFKVDHIPPSASGGFVVEQRDQNSRIIIENTGIPFDLVGSAGDQAHANLSTRLQAYNNTDVKFYRLCLSHVWSHQWYGRNIMAIIRRRYARLKAKLPQTEEPVDQLTAQSMPAPGDITKREANNIPEEDEIDLIIEDERVIWDTNRKLQISKLKSMVEKEIQENGLTAIDDSKKEEIYKELGITGVEKSKPTGETYKKDSEPFDLASELGVDLITPSTPEYELQVLEELIKYTDYSRLPFQIKIIFTNTSFDTDIETALATIGLNQADIIPKERAQQKTGNEDLIEQTKEETQIKLFMAKALAPVIAEAQKQAQAQEVDVAKAQMTGKMTVNQPGKQPQTNEPGGSAKKSQIDLKNRTNAMTKLSKKAGLQNYTSV